MQLYIVNILFKHTPVATHIVLNLPYILNLDLFQLILLHLVRLRLVRLRLVRQHLVRLQLVRLRLVRHWSLKGTAIICQKLIITLFFFKKIANFFAFSYLSIWPKMLTITPTPDWLDPMETFQPLEVFGKT
jgi:hypothetical protein